MSSQPVPIHSARLAVNRVLARLDPPQFAVISAAAQILTLKPGTVLHAPEAPLDRVYFPLSGTVSLVTLSAEGTMVEAATIGNEGTTGVPLFLVGDLGPLQIIAQIPGEAAVVPASVLSAQLNGHSSLDDAMRRYTHAQMVQTAQTAMCNRLHELHERTARWLLQSHDRVPGDSFSLTHEFLSIMLGVRRPTVTLAMGTLQQAGLVASGRGTIEVLDRQGLEEASCECYAVITAEYERLLPSA